MSNIKSAKKRAKQNKKKNNYNNNYKSMMKTFIKKIYFYIKNNNIIKAKKQFYIIQSILDKLAKKNIIHKNKANRYKSRLINKINKKIQKV